MQRPLSPHLRIYRPQVTSVMSILHRLSGVFIVLGLAWVSSVFIAVPYGREAYERWAAVVFSTPGRLLLLMLCAALFYHLCNGVRHLVWDLGRGLEIVSITRSAVAVLAGALLLLALLAW